MKVVKILTHERHIFFRRTTEDDYRTVLHVPEAGEDMVSARHGHNCQQSRAHTESFQQRGVHGEALHR